MTPPLTASRETCRDFARSSKLEWLETNGTGAFAMGTVAGVNTRRYHGLLVAWLAPPSGRRVLFSRVEEEAAVDGRTFALAACQYPGIVTPRGFELLDEFRPEPCATWVYGLHGVRLEKQVYLVEGKQAVVIRYRADRRLTLRVRPFLADRDYHSLQRAGGWTSRALQFHTSARLMDDPHWYYNIEYLEELDRGFDFREDLYSPGVFVLDLKPGEWTPICASADGARAFKELARTTGPDSAEPSRVPDGLEGRAGPVRAFKELARTTEPDSAEPSRVPDGLEGRAGPVRALKELARTTEPDSAEPSRVPDGLEGRAGPVRAFKELARTTEPDSAEPPRVPDGLEGRAGPVRALKELARTTEPDSAEPSRVPDGLEGRAGPVRAQAEPAAKRDPFVVRRADGSPTVIAGYPWFTDWGRDTMISLPGLLIDQGRLEEARRIIEGFLNRRNRGIIPNRLPETGEAPEYNTADATLWMFQAMRAWLTAGGDRAFLRDVFYPAAKDILDWHRRGTWYGIGVDPEDHLLRAGGPDTQLTWMDARADGRAVTPRHGKPVEINALWHGALCLMADWGDDGCRAEALAVRENFRAKFWNPAGECLYDVLAEDGPVSKLRPNQIFSVSLGNDLLERDRQQAVVRIVERELLTPVGLRTLNRGDPEYKPRYQGGPAERDGAYHQGTVWPWLMGPFIDAYLCAFGKTAETLAYCRGLGDKLEEEAARGPCLGSVPEIYDGEKPDAEEPRIARGCPAQAWSVAELARLKEMLRGML